MVHFEFGVFVLFSTTLLGLVGFVLQNHFLLPPWLAWYNHASRYAASSFPTPSCGSSKAPLSLEARFSPRFSGCPSLSSAGRLVGSASIEAAGEKPNEGCVEVFDPELGGTFAATHA